VTLRATDGIDDSSKGIDIDVGRRLDLSETVNVVDQTDYPYVVPNNGPLSIDAGVTVRIEAGVKVFFTNTGGGLEVAGTLDINGTDEEMVLLAPGVCPGETGFWKGIRYIGEQAAGSISNLMIAYTRDGLTIENGAVVTADSIAIDKASRAGVSVKNGGELTLSHSRISDSSAGIYVTNGILLLQDSIIRDNGNFGLSFEGGAGTFSATVTGCEIANNTIDGIVLGEAAAPVVNGCSMYWNGGGQGEYRVLSFEVGYSYYGTIDMTGNYWGVSTSEEIEQQIIRNGAGATVDYTGWLEEPPLRN
jgi:hypothetical protein